MPALYSYSATIADALDPAMMPALVCIDGSTYRARDILLWEGSGTLVLFARPEDLVTHEDPWHNLRRALLEPVDVVFLLHSGEVVRGTAMTMIGQFWQDRQLLGFTVEGNLRIDMAADKETADE